MIRSSLQSSRTSRGRHAGPAEKFHLRSPDAWTATAARGLEMTALRAVTLRPATAREPRATPEVMLRAAILVVRSKSVRLLRRGKALNLRVNRRRAEIQCGWMSFTRMKRQNRVWGFVDLD